MSLARDVSFSGIAFNVSSIFFMGAEVEQH
jgi:hypothetical protein